MKRTVFIETTIPSFYFEVRQEPEMVARRECTRRWWAQERIRYDLVSSVFTLAELDRGNYPGKADALQLVQDLPVLGVTPEIESIAEVYIRRKLMPAEDAGDAYHLAAASYYGISFLLTWNCRHLANANKAFHVRSINAELGLSIPVITTPDMLFAEDES
ncbi:MAG: type II toxin-antitoxin system VapC family toxin [Planctomycetes bacterium]|nr:type II toxin-antitoxin system VapC family toxin [Planctomycetota bacterium]